MFAKSHGIVHTKHSVPFSFETFVPEGSGPFPVIFQTPILGQLSILEDLFFERRFARYFARHGFFSVLIHRPIFQFDPRLGLEQIQKYLEDQLIRNQRVFEKVLTLPKTDPHRMGTFGMSFGSIVNLLWASEEKRLTGNAFALPGGNLPEIFMKSRDALMKSYREAALASCNQDAAHLNQCLRKLFTRDPLQAASSIAANHTLMILARFDRVVPYAYGKELMDKIGKPQAMILPLGHYFSLLAAPLIRGRVIRFFKNQFS